MTHGYGEGIGGIQMLGVDVNPERLLDNQRHLLLGRRTVAADCLLGLSGSIFIHFGATGQRSGHSGSLSPSKLENNLGITAVERRLDGEVVRMMQIAKGAHFIKNDMQLLVYVIYPAKVENAHVHVLRLA